MPRETVVKRQLYQRQGNHGSGNQHTYLYGFFGSLSAEVGPGVLGEQFVAGQEPVERHAQHEALLTLQRDLHQTRVHHKVTHVPGRP